MQCTRLVFISAGGGWKRGENSSQLLFTFSIHVEEKEDKKHLYLLSCDEHSSISWTRVQEDSPRWQCNRALLIQMNDIFFKLGISWLKSEGTIACAELCCPWSDETHILGCACPDLIKHTPLDHTPLYLLLGDSWSWLSHPVQQSSSFRRIYLPALLRSQVEEATLLECLFPRASYYSLKRFEALDGFYPLPCPILRDLLKYATN